MRFKTNVDLVMSSDILELTKASNPFKSFIAQCVEHFVHFVVPRRDQSNIIEQEYPMPKSLSDISMEAVILMRDSENRVHVSCV